MLKITKNQGSIQVTADKSGFYPFDGTITFPTNSLFTATSANTDMITFKSTSNGDVQFVGNYKDITISGRSYDTKQKFLTAFSNLANQGSVDAYTKAETDAKLNAKQGKLKAGNGITLTEDATDNTTVVKTAVSLTDNGNGAYEVGDGIAIGGRSSVRIGNNNNVLQGQNSIIIGDHAMTSSEKCIAIGNSSEVNAGSTCSIVIGDSAIANGSQNIAIGDNRSCEGTKNVGIGCGKLDTVDVNGNSNVCIGENSNIHKKDNTNVDESVAIGKNTRSESSYSVAIGRNAFSKQFYGIAIGSGAGATADDRVTNSDSIAIGTFSRADGNCSIAIGDYSSSKKGGVAIGKNGKATAEKGIAIGEWALASVENGVAIGELAQTAADSPLVIRAGNKTVDGRKLPITMIQGDANGKISFLKGDGTDTRMVIQDEIEALKNAGGSGGGANPLVNVKGTSGDATIAEGITDGVAIGSGASVNGEYCVAIGSGTSATADMPLVIRAGYKTVDGNKDPLTVLQSDSTGKLSILKGDGTDERIVIQDALSAGGTGGGGTVDAYTKAETDTKLEAKQDKLTAGTGITITKDETAGTSTIATAVSLTDNGDGAYQVGNSIKMGSNTVAIGTSSVSRTKWSIAIGDGATSGSGGSNIAIGNVANSSGGTSIAIGKNAVTSNSNATAIGTMASAGIPKSIAIGYDAKTSTNIPMVINAGGKTMFQGDANGKISIPLGDGTTSTMCLQDEIAALKAEIAALKGGASTGA